jgi:acetyl esterase/lipase
VVHRRVRARLAEQDLPAPNSDQSPAEVAVLCEGQECMVRSHRPAPNADQSPAVLYMPGGFVYFCDRMVSI